MNVESKDRNSFVPLSKVSHRANFQKLIIIEQIFVDIIFTEYFETELKCRKWGKFRFRP